MCTRAKQMSLRSNNYVTKYISQKRKLEKMMTSFVFLTGLDGFTFFKQNDK